MLRDDAGQLNNDNGMGGANIAAQQRFWVGINDTLGNAPTGDAFDEKSMRLFDGWDNPNARFSLDPRDRARATVARGAQLFNSMPIDISGVGGLNDATGLPVIHGSCSSCHNSPHIGHHSVGLSLDLGLTDASRRTPDMPLYTLTNPSAGKVVRTTDPGLAMITGKWADIGKFKGPILRGVAARAVLPQRLGGHPGRRGQFLRHPLQHPHERAAETLHGGVFCSPHSRLHWFRSSRGRLSARRR